MRRKTRSFLTSVFALMFMLCAFVFGLTLMPTQTAKADGETMLTEMNFTVTTPINGNTYDTNIVSVAPEQYTATFERVWDKNKNGNMTVEETFLYGGEYSYVFYIAAGEGYTFDEDTKVYLNGIEASSYSANHRYVDMKIPLKIEVIGGHLYTDGTYEEIKTGETYTYERGYLYADSAPEGMVFHKWKRTNVKTSEVNENYSGSQKLEDYFGKGSSHYVYEAVYAIPLDNIEINIPFEAGLTLQELVPVGLDANKDNYTIEITDCYYYDDESNEVTLNPTDTFFQGEVYYFDFYIHSKEGYIYSQTNQITVNGKSEYRNSSNWLDNSAYYRGADLYDLVPITLDVTDGIVYKDGVVTEEREFLAGTTVTVVIDESKYPEGKVFRNWNVSNSYWVSYGDTRCKEFQVTIKKPSSENTVVPIYPTYAELWGINRISVDVIHPEPGKTPSDYISSSYSNYFAEIIGWYLDGELLAPDYVFVEGESYTVRVKASAAPSYYFEDPQTYTYYIYHEFSGAPADDEEELVDYEENGAYVVYEATKVAKAKQNPISITVVAPMPGMRPSDVLTYDESVKCNVEFDCWRVYDEEIGAWREMTSQEVFKVGGQYQVRVYFYGNNTVFLPEGEFNVTINGMEGSRFSSGTSKTNYTEGYDREFTVEAAPELYDIIVGNGQATIDSLTVTETGAGVIVTITANAPESGYAFKMWAVTSGENVFFVDAKSSMTTFVMPANNVTVTAVYRYIPNTITVTGGLADWEEAGKEETITITLGEIPTNHYFSHWVVNAGGVLLADEYAETTTFVMGEAAVEIQAIFEEQTLLTRLDFKLGGLKDGLTTVDDIVSTESDKYVGTFKTIVGNGVDYTFGDAFIGGESYKYYFYLEVDKEYRIDSGTSIYINGNKYCYRNVEEGRIVCYAYIDALRRVTVVNGKAYEDSECTIPLTHAEYSQYFYVVADATPAGMQFAGWEIDGDAWWDNKSYEKMRVMQYGENLTITVIYKKLYTITVTVGTANYAQAVEGTKVTLTRGENPEGKYQIGWSVNGGETFTSDYFTMLDEEVVVTPVYHTHVYDSWNSSGSYHWQNCTDPACPNYNQSQRNYEKHTYDHDCDNICNTCEYERTVRHNFTSEWTSDDEFHWHVCTTEGCSAISGKEAHNVSSAATCQEQAYCSVCSSRYGELDADNHTGTAEWTKTETTHKQVYTCCEAVVVEEAPHTGGNATCIKQAECSVCGKAYGEYNANNHEDEVVWYITATTHEKCYEDCCGKVVIATGSHNFKDGVCTICQLNTNNIINSVVISGLKVPLYNQEVEYFYNLLKENVYTTLTINGEVLNEDTDLFGNIYLWDFALFDENRNIIADKNHIITSGTYYLGLALGSVSGYPFADDVTVSVNGATSVETDLDYNLIVYAKYEVSPEVIEEITVTGVEPQFGLTLDEYYVSTMDMTINGATYSENDDLYGNIVMVYGAILDSNKQEIEGGDFVFSDGTYYVCFVLWADYGYQFPVNIEDLTVAFDGAVDVEFEYDEGLLVILAKYDVTHTCVDTDTKDHLCDYCSETVSQCIDVLPKDHVCDICGAGEMGTHEAATGKHTCDYCGETVSQCIDVLPKDHVCDICGEGEMGTHEAATGKHTCDYCGEPVSQCTDVLPKDHVCDICGEGGMGTHEAATGKHTCDYCGETVSQCIDVLPKDHVCDICGEGGMGTHEAATGKHTCDYCGETVSQCTDVLPKDHVCDICGAGEMGTHEAATGKHTCDYCGETVSQCTDVLPKDHVCDICGEGEMGTHEAATGKHTCDYCGETVSQCIDVLPKDHVCDICGAGEMGTHEAATGKHTCDYCGETVSQCIDVLPKDHVCDICGETVSSHVDEDDNGICDVCEEQLGSGTPETPDNPKDGLSGGAIAGIVVGSVAVAGLGGFALVWFVIKKKSFADLIAIFKKK